jgi:hypothetical protein
METSNELWLSTRNRYTFLAVLSEKGLVEPPLAHPRAPKRNPSAARCGIGNTLRIAIILGTDTLFSLHVRVLAWNLPDYSDSWDSVEERPPLALCPRIPLSSPT